MRILFLGNNLVALDILKWLHTRDDELVGLVLHPAEKQRYGSDLVEASALPAERIFDGSKLREPDTFEAIEKLGADVCLSILFDYILKEPFIDLFPQGVINLHPSYLPYNRGQYPNVWSIVEGTPAGVTLHYIDAGIDTGDIIAQQEVEVTPTDTGASLYRRLEQTAVTLFQDAWPHIASGTASRSPQAAGGGTSHRTRDVENIDCIDLDKSYTARDLINILRARTFPPYKGAYFEEDGKRVYLHLGLSLEEDV